MLKFIAKVIVFIAVIVGAFVLWVELDKRKAKPTPAAAAVAAPAAAPAAAPPPGAPRAAAAAPAPASRRAQFDEAARSARVRIAKFAETPSGATVTVEWTGDVATNGGDFLDAGIRAGIVRDFEEGARNMKYDKQGRRVWSAEFRLRY